MLRKINIKAILFILGAGFLMNLLSSNDKPVESQNLLLTPAAITESATSVQTPTLTPVEEVETSSLPASEVEKIPEEVTPPIESSVVKTKEEKPAYTPTDSVEPTPSVTPDTYTNSQGNTIQSPTHYDSTPVGASAVCRDGTYSFSQSRRGTCSHHGGVDQWL